LHSSGFPRFFDLLEESRKRASYRKSLKTRVFECSPEFRFALIVNIPDRKKVTPRLFAAAHFDRTAMH